MMARQLFIKLLLQNRTIIASLNRRIDRKKNSLNGKYYINKNAYTRLRWQSLHYTNFIIFYINILNRESSKVGRLYEMSSDSTWSKRDARLVYNERQSNNKWEISQTSSDMWRVALDVIRFYLYRRRRDDVTNRLHETSAPTCRPFYRFAYTYTFSDEKTIRRGKPFIRQLCGVHAEITLRIYDTPLLDAI